MTNSLSNYLADYLSFSLGKDAARRASDAIVLRYGSLAVIASSTKEELLRIEGMTESAALSLKLLSYLYGRSITDKFQRRERYSEEEISRLVKALFSGLTVETVYCLLFDADSKLISIEYLGEGTVNSSEIYPRRIVECACRRGASGVIIAHNHPKGTALASEADYSATSFINNVLLSAGIRLFAHYLVSDTECNKMDIDLLR